MALRIGVTGGIGSGKSTVAQLFHELGVPVLDTDDEARRLVLPGQPALEQIVRVFGKEALTPTGGLNRAAVRALIFSTPAKRRELEQILHPLIRAAVTGWAQLQQASYCLIVIPLLVESGWVDDVDRVLVIDTPVTLQLQRAMARDQAEETQVRAIIDTQCSREERLAVADDIITNDSDAEHLRRQVEQLHQAYLALASRPAE